MNKAVIYCRVSSVGQDETHGGTSLVTQFASCKAKCDALDLEVVAYHEDVKSGASYLTRAGLQAALKDLEAGRASHLVVYDLSRYSRDLEHQTTIKKRVQACGATLVFCTADYDDTPEGNLLFGINGVIATFERLKTRERSVIGRQAKAQSGQQPARSFRPFGYKIIQKRDVIRGTHTEEQLGKYEVVEDEAKWVRQVFSRYAAGESLNQLCLWLMRSGVKPPRQGAMWRASNLKRIMENPTYKGRAYFGRTRRMETEAQTPNGCRKRVTYAAQPESEWTLLECPALVDEKMWIRCQERLRESRALYGGRPDRKYLLTGIFRCSRCGMSMRGLRQWWDNKGGRGFQQTYSCRWGRKHHRPDYPICDRSRYEANTIEAAVLHCIEQMACNPANIMALYEAQQEALRHDGAPGELKQIEVALEALDKKELATVEAQIEAKVNGTSTVVYDKVLKEIAAKRTTFGSRLQELSAMQSREALKPKDLSRFMAEAAKAVRIALHAPELTIAQKHDLIAKVIESVAVQGGKVIVKMRPIADEEGLMMQLADVDLKVDRRRKVKQLVN